jgi:hypothetical protein
MLNQSSLKRVSIKVSMSELGFRVQGSKAYVIRNGNEKEIPRDSILEIYQLVLGNIAPNRDYSSVTSVRKLLRIIDLECEPDESDGESDDEDEESEEEAPVVSNPTRGRRPAVRTVRRAVKPDPKDDTDDEDSDDE